MQQNYRKTVSEIVGVAEAEHHFRARWFKNFRKILKKFGELENFFRLCFSDMCRSLSYLCNCIVV